MDQLGKANSHQFIRTNFFEFNIGNSNELMRFVASNQLHIIDFSNNWKEFFDISGSNTLWQILYKNGSSIPLFSGLINIWRWFPFPLVPPPFFLAPVMTPNPKIFLNLTKKSWWIAQCVPHWAEATYFLPIIVISQIREIAVVIFFKVKNG